MITRHDIGVGMALVSVFAIGFATTRISNAADPKEVSDDTWLSVSGTVVSATPDSFRLDYGDGVITVEMDDFDFYAEGYGLLPNDQVIVTGIVDDDLFETRTIEASSVYVENLGTHFYANAVDEEDFSTWTMTTPVVLNWATATGTVTSKSGREFTIDTTTRSVTVDTENMAFNPMDDHGFLKIDVGDRVKVGGDIDTGFFDGREIEADWIVKYNR